MKIKKTIAAIAAAAMVFSSLPMTVLADETNENGSTPAVDGGYGSEQMNASAETEQTPVVQADNQGDEETGEEGAEEGTYEPTVTASKVPTGYNGLSLSINSNSDIYGVTATETQLKGTSFSPADASIGRTTDGYYLGFHVDALDKSKNGDVKPSYERAFTYVANLDDNTIKGLSYGTGSSEDGQFWACMRKGYLTPADKTGKPYLVYAIKAKYGDDETKYYYIAVKWDDLSNDFVFTNPCSGDHTTEDPCTVCGNTKSTLNPEPVTPGPTDAEKVATAISNLESGYFNYDFTWVDVNDQGHLDTIASQIATNAGVEGVEASLVGYTTGSNGMVTFTIKLKVGAEEVLKDVTLQCKAPEVPVVPETPAPSTSGSSGFVAPPATITTTTVVSTTASTPSQVRTSSKSNITINAAETKVTPAIMNAFTKNKKAKTLTVSYGTKMKIAIKKSDVKGTANVDFSVSGKSFLSSKVKNSAALAKAKKITQIDFVKEGKLDGVDKATVQSRVGAKYVGRKATVYEYVNGKLVKVAKTTVGGSGLVKFNIDHYGQYVIAVE